MKKKSLGLQKLTLVKDTIGILNAKNAQALAGGQTLTICASCPAECTIITCQNQLTCQHDSRVACCA